MFGKLTYVLAAMIALSLIFVGCSDDDCPNCPNADQTAVMFGEVEIDGGQIEFYGAIFGIDGGMPDIDSVRVDGELALIEDYIGEGIGSYMEYQSNDLGDPHTSGEIINIRVFTPTGMSECNAVALEDDADEPELIMEYSQYYPYDTVAIGTDISFDWHPVANADFYVVDVYYRWGPEDDRTEYYTVTNDTTFSIPGSETQYDGYYYFYIIAAAGPNPLVDDGNITGDVVKGMINSYQSDGFDLYIGDGNPWDGPVKSSIIEDERPTADDIMKKVRGF